MEGGNGVTVYLMAPSDGPGSSPGVSTKNNFGKLKNFIYFYIRKKYE